MLSKLVRLRPLNSLCIGLPKNMPGLVLLSEKTTENTINFNRFMPWNCNSSIVKRLSLSPDAKWMALILADGSLKLYSLEFMLQQAFQTLQPRPVTIDRDCVRLHKHLDAFDKEVRVQRHY